MKSIQLHHFIRTWYSATLLLFVTTSFGQAVPKKWLLALSKADHTMAVVNPTDLKIITRIPVGIDPHEMVASSDGKTVYVCIYGGGSLHDINVIDLVNFKPLPSIDTRPLYGPHDITFVKGKVWFTAEGSKAVGRYDPATARLDWSMGTGQDRTHMIYVTPDGKTIYTTNMTSGTVSVLTATSITQGVSAPTNSGTREDWTQTIIATAKGSEGFDVTPNGTELWTASSDDGIISIIDLVNKKLLSRIQASVFGANRLKFTPDGKMAFISSLRNGELTIIDVASRKELKRLTLGRGAAGILMDEDGSRAFVACSPDNYISIINLKTLEVTGKLEVGGVPDGLALAIQR